MTPSPWLYDFLRGHIPFRPTAWRKHRGDPWVIGYGHTGGTIGEVVAGATCSLEDAERILRCDIDTAAVQLHDGAGMTQGAFDVAVALLVAGAT